MKDLAQVLRDARTRIAAGDAVFMALSRSASGDDFNAAVDLLTQVLLPTAAVYEAAVLKFARTKADADGRQAMQLSRLPGAHVQFWSWIEGPARQSWAILAGFDRAILRAGRPTQF